MTSSISRAMHNRIDAMTSTLSIPSLSGKQWAEVDQFVLKYRGKLENADSLKDACILICDKGDGATRSESHLAAVLAGMEARKVRVSGCPIVRVGSTRIRIDTSVAKSA